jgi:hypothetical protein
MNKTGKSCSFDFEISTSPRFGGGGSRMAKSTGKMRPLPTSWAALSVLAEAYDEPEPDFN